MHGRMQERIYFFLIGFIRPNFGQAEAVKAMLRSLVQGLLVSDSDWRGVRINRLASEG